MLKTNVAYPFTKTWLDYPDGEGVAISVYFMGCDNGCRDCSNPFFLSKESKRGTIMQESEFIEKLRESTKLSNTNKVVLTGGDPLFKENIEFTKNFLNKYYKEFDICVYTGKSVGYVKENKITNFSYIKTGLFDKTTQQMSVKTDKYLTFSSINQELYDSDFKLLSENGIYRF